MESIGEYLQQDTIAVANQEKERSLTPVRVVYLRVSSAEREDELEREREVLQSIFPDAKFITDVGSGIDFYRPGLTSLVRQICRDQVSQVVVTSKDRIGRFFWDFFEFICKEHSCSLVVHGNGVISYREEEIKDEYFEIMGIFAASRSGLRSAHKREARTQRGDQGEVILEQETEEVDRLDVIG